MKIMMETSFVVRSGCGTPLWLSGGNSGGLVMVGVVVGGSVINIEYRGSLVMVVEEKKRLMAEVGQNTR
jgi:hypothetical protein